MSLASDVINSHPKRFRFLLEMFFHFLIMILNSKVEFELLSEEFGWIFFHLVPRFHFIGPRELLIVQLFDAFQALIWSLMLAAGHLGRWSI